MNGRRVTTRSFPLVSARDEVWQPTDWRSRARGDHGPIVCMRADSAACMRGRRANRANDPADDGDDDAARTVVVVV